MAKKQPKPIKTFTPVTFIRQFAKVETLKGDICKIPIRTYFQLKEARNRANQKLDAVVVITGPVGSGKSNKAKVIAGIWQEHFRGVSYTLDQVHFTAQAFNDKCDETDNREEVINFDEAIQGGGSKDGATKVGKIFKEKLITKRTKRHLYIMTVDSLKELNDKIIERCVAWYHVYYTRTEEGIFIKGWFKSFNPQQALAVYEDLKEKRIRDTKQHPIFRKNNFIQRDEFCEQFYTEEEYDKKKLHDTSQQIEQEESKFQKDRDNLIKWCVKEKGFKQREVADAIKMSNQQLSRIIAKSPTL